MTTASSFTGVSFAGEIVLDNVSILNADGLRKVDITFLFMELNLYEDIFSNSLSGSVTLVENFNLISGFPIIGEEVLEVEFHTNALPDGKNRFKKTFHIYKVSNRVAANDKKNVYILHLMSQEVLIDTNTKISKAYSGYGENIVTDIFNEHFKAFETPLFVSEASSNYVKFVANYWSPFKSINYACSRSASKDSFKTPSFLFFENSRGFNFTSLSNIYAKEPVTAYFYDTNQKRIRNQDGESVRDVEREYQTAESMEIEYTVDFLERMMHGVYGNKMYEFDILNKTFNYSSYGYFDNFNDTTHLEKNPMCTFAFANNARISSNVSMPFVHDMFKTDSSSDIKLKRIPLLAQSEMYKVNLSVPGRTDVGAGDVVIFNMMDNSSVGTADEAKSADMTDKYYSGRYMVGAIMHRITQTRHKMQLQLVRESFVNKIVIGETM